MSNDRKRVRSVNKIQSDRLQLKSNLGKIFAQCVHSVRKDLPSDQTPTSQDQKSILELFVYNQEVINHVQSFLFPDKKYGDWRTALSTLPDVSKMLEKRRTMAIC